VNLRKTLAVMPEMSASPLSEAVKLAWRQDPVSGAPGGVFPNTWVFGVTAFAGWRERLPPNFGAAERFGD